MTNFIEIDSALNYFQFISIKLYQNANVVKFVCYGKTLIVLSNGEKNQLPELSCFFPVILRDWFLLIRTVFGGTPSSRLVSVTLPLLPSRTRISVLFMDSVRLVSGTQVTSAVLWNRKRPDTSELFKTLVVSVVGGSRISQRERQPRGGGTLTYYLA